MSNTRRFWERLAVDFCSRDLLLEDPLFEAPAYSSFQFDLDEDIDHDAYNRWFAWCRTCRRPFVRITPNKKFCSLECARPTSRNNKRTEVRAAHEIKFVGIDGEGISVKDSNGKIIHHYYVLIVANGIGVEPLVLHKNGERLTTEEIFEWLYNVVFAAHPDACFVTYSMGYDLSQWIKDLPESRARMLFTKQGIASRKRRNSANPTPFPVYWRPDRGSPREWELDTLGTKRLKFRVRERGWRNFSGQDGDRETETKAPPWMYINDVFSFFQCSFIKAIDPAPRLKAGTPSIVTAEEFATILEGKARRTDAVFDETMIKYCALECDVLARLMRELNQGMVENDIRLKRTQFFGPGQTAQATMDLLVKSGAGDFTRKNIEDHVPFTFRDAARQSYFGGWFDVNKHGLHGGTSYEYDINSAYPNVMTQLPCLLHGQYLAGDGSPYRSSKLKRHRNHGFGLGPRQSLCLVDAHVTGSHPCIGAMLHRRKNGRVLRPHQTAGWYWLHELEAAKRAGLIDEVRFYSWFAYVPCDCPKPLRTFEGMYLKRLQVGKNTPQGVALKQASNSPYGKMVQSVGQPKYANAVYASLITAGCRCMILDVIATHPLGPNAVLMVATDGIFCTQPHPSLEVSDMLGAWELKLHENLMLFKPGMYWDDDTRELVRNGEFARVNFKTRGVNREAMAKVILALDDAFAAMKPGDDWPSLPIEIPFQVISPQQALARNKWRLCGAVSNTRSIRVSADPWSKRFAIAPGWSEPYEQETPLRSTPYNATFGDETVPLDLLDPARAALTDNLHPDGFLLHQLAEMFFDGGPGIGEI